jgi:signal transduction histidine kinase
MNDYGKTKGQLIIELNALRARLAELERSVPAVYLSGDEQLDTVSVPKPFEAIFLKAQNYVKRYFSSKIEDPRHSNIIISGERYILVRAASMSVEFFEMVMSLYQDKGEFEARNVANNLLFDVAHSIGKADARIFHAKMGVEDPIEKLSAGPVHFSFSGWAFVRIFPESSPSPDENYYLIYDHPFSFESDAWIKRGLKVDFPVCIMNAGYSSGWCEESFGLPLVAAEVECMAKGDAQCRFIMAPPTRIEERLAAYFEKTELSGAQPHWHPHSTSITVPEFFQRKRMEEALRESRDQLEIRVQQRTKELARAYKALQVEMTERQQAEVAMRASEERLRQSQKMEAIGQLAGGVAHDFNNMLTVIINYNDYILKALAPEDPLHGKAEQIKKAADRSASLTRQLLAFSRKQVLQPKVISFNEVISNLKEMLRQLLDENIEIITELEPKLGNVKADPSQLEHVLINLAVNARDAMPEGGKLTISTANVELDGPVASQLDGLVSLPCVMLTVNDNGRGMDAETQSHIFEPFFTTKSITNKGTGLGLPSVYGIIKQSNGHIEVESALDQGATFRIYLPMVESQATMSEPTHDVAPEGWETILLVEDEDAVREMTREILMLQGYNVFEAASGAEALAFCSQYRGPIHLLLTDIVMPQMGGKELATQITKMRPSMKILFMSGYSGELVAPSDTLDKNQAFISKPFTLNALADKLRKLLD